MYGKMLAYLVFLVSMVILECRAHFDFIDAILLLISTISAMIYGMLSFKKE